VSAQRHFTPQCARDDQLAVNHSTGFGIGPIRKGRLTLLGLFRKKCRFDQPWLAESEGHLHSMVEFNEKETKDGSGR
jgi:hypothetical protein